MTTEEPITELEEVDRDLSEQEYRDLADGVAATRAFARGDVTYLDEPAETPPAPEGEPLVVRSLRLSLDLEVRVKSVASRMGVPPTVLMREWVIDGVEAAENGNQRDPVAELHRIADAASRALRLLGPRRDAA